MFKNLTILCSITCLTLILAGCYSIAPATITDKETLHSAKTAYIVVNPKVIGSFQDLISADLASRGIKTQIGPISEKPDNVDIYVTYVAYHSWDMSRYLKSYTITIFDNKTNTMLAADNFRTGFWHDFANSTKVTSIMIDNMFN